MLEENVVSSAGAKHRSNLPELIELIRGAGRVPAQRNTTYEILRVHDDPKKDPVDERVVSHLSSTADEGLIRRKMLKVVANA
jgi:cyclic dehypoxanthinyl futalosine synthase